MHTDINYTAYNDQAQKYIANNLEGTTGGFNPVKRVERFKEFLPSGTVLEIGSGAGLDAIALQNQGFKVIASDFAPRFIDLLKSKNLNVIELNAKDDEIPEDIQPLDGIYANAVLVHFSPEEFHRFLDNAYKSLREGGVLFLSLILGEGNEISGRAKGIEREFFYYNETSVDEIVNKTGFIIDKIEFPIETKWMHIFMHK